MKRRTTAIIMAGALGLAVLAPAGAAAQTDPPRDPNPPGYSYRDGRGCPQHGYDDQQDRWHHGYRDEQGRWHDGYHDRQHHRYDDRHGRHHGR